MRRGGYSARVNGLHLLGVAEDVAQLLGKEAFLVLGEIQVCEGGDALDIRNCQCGGHGLILSQSFGSFALGLSMGMRRRASVAGRWYADDPEELAAEVDAYVSRAHVDVPAGPLRAIVVPHAGLKYSGPVAAFAYRAAMRANYRCVVLVGPSHFVPFDGVSLWSGGEWDTPFGPVDVDRELASHLREESREIVDVIEAHGREHSLEMQLPFIAHLLPGVPIVPLVMGNQTRQTAFLLGEALARLAATRLLTSSTPGSDMLFVASSDLSHYEDARTAAKLDSLVIDSVVALDPGGLMDVLERDPRHACGGGPMVAVLHTARQLGATDSRLLRYADSGDVSGDKSSVVGYMAAGIW